PGPARRRGGLQARRRGRRPHARRGHQNERGELEMSRFDALGERHEVELGQGTVRYRERGSGDPLVFVHGVLVNGDLWRNVVPRAISLLRHSTRLKAIRRAPFGFGWLMNDDISPKLFESWSAPLADPGVRRDVTKVLRGIHKRHTLAAAERLGAFQGPVLLAW